MGVVENTALERVDARVGTRFWIFPQPPFIQGYEQPDRVWLALSRDEIRSGPSDMLMYVADPLFDKQPYGNTPLAAF